MHIDSILKQLGGEPALGEVCRFLRLEVPSYHWIGIYLVQGDELVLSGWSGDSPTEHVRIPISRGICGQAVRENRTVNVPDVGADASYLACFLDTRSELVVPIRDSNGAIGEIDVDATELSAFDGNDERFLQQVAARLVATARAAADSRNGPSG